MASIPQRLGASSVIGIACMVAVFISVLAMGNGFKHTLAGSARSDRVIVLRAGSDAELNSNLSRPDIDTISNAPGIAIDPQGHRLLSAEIVTVVDLPTFATRKLLQRNAMRRWERRNPARIGNVRGSDLSITHIFEG